MKIIACVRTFNEEANIRRFMESYVWADAVIVSDSGSTDRTVEIAEKYDNAVILRFDEKVVVDGVAIRPPHGTHINQLIRHAWARDADWIIFDDCDCVPNYLLRLGARDLLESNIFDTAFVYRMYVYGEDKWFPGMCDAGQSLWAWKPSANIWASEEEPLKHHMQNISDNGAVLDFPYTLLHYFAPDEETIQRKLDFYNGYKPDVSLHPAKFCGVLEQLPEYARI